jgi:hypothetical protein
MGHKKTDKGWAHGRGTHILSFSDADDTISSTVESGEWQNRLSGTIKLEVAETTFGVLCPEIRALVGSRESGCAVHNTARDARAPTDAVDLVGVCVPWVAPDAARAAGEVGVVARALG